MFKYQLLPQGGGPTPALAIQLMYALQDTLDFDAEHVREVTLDTELTAISVQMAHLGTYLYSLHTLFLA